MSNQPNVLKQGQIAVHRSLTGAPVAVDPAVSGTFPLRGQNIQTRDFVKIGVKVSITGGGSATLEALAYDANTDTYFVVATTAALSDGGYATIDTWELPTFFRVSAVTGAPPVNTVTISVWPITTAVRP